MNRRQLKIPQWPRARRIGSRLGRDGFTIVEVLVALALFAVVSLFVVQAFVSGMGYSRQSNERAAATTLGMQIMEQIRASVNPYTMVGFTPLTRQPLPLPAPYTNVTNPTRHPLEVAVDVTPNNDLTLTTVTVSVYRPTDSAPFVTLTTVLDDS